MSDPACNEKELLIQAELDGELDAVQTAELMRHVEHCPRCAALRDQLLGLSQRLGQEAAYHRMPSALRARLVAEVSPAPQVIRRSFAPRLPSFGYGAIGFAMAACLALVLLPRGGPDMTDEVIASHIRALQPGHLEDVISTDRHTVKPWFDGRLDFAPPVQDFVAQGFPLVGGRLDYLDGRPVAALVYRRDKHIINLFVWPAPGAADTAPEGGVRAGYDVLSWRQGGMQFWAASDVEAAALRQFAGLWMPPPAGVH